MGCFLMGCTLTNHTINPMDYNTEDFKSVCQNAHAWELAYLMSRAIETERYEKAAVIRDTVRQRIDELDDVLVESVLNSQSEHGKRAKLAFRPNE